MMVINNNDDDNSDNDKYTWWYVESAYLLLILYRFLICLFITGTKRNVLMRENGGHRARLWNKLD